MATEAKVIMEIPNQRFSFLKDASLVDDWNARVSFTEECTGTILLITGIAKDNEEAIIPFGIPDGETEARIAFWLPYEAFENLWEKMIEEKQKCTKED